MDASVEKRDVEDADGGGEQKHRARTEPMPDVAEILRKTNVARGDLERSAQDELPYEQKSHQAAESLGSERFAKVSEGSAGARHRGPQFAPDHPVADDDHERGEPAEHRLRSAERGQ